jgi:hypothetical protein
MDILLYLELLEGYLLLLDFIRDGRYRGNGLGKLKESVRKY